MLMEGQMNPQQQQQNSVASFSWPTEVDGNSKYTENITYNNI